MHAHAHQLARTVHYSFRWSAGMITVTVDKAVRLTNTHISTYLFILVSPYIPTHAYPTHICTRMHTHMYIMHTRAHHSTLPEQFWYDHVWCHPLWRLSLLPRHRPLLQQHRALHSYLCVGRGVLVPKASRLHRISCWGRYEHVFMHAYVRIWMCMICTYMLTAYSYKYTHAHTHTLIHMHSY